MKLTTLADKEDQSMLLVGKSKTKEFKTFVGLAMLKNIKRFIAVLSSATHSSSCCVISKQARFCFSTQLCCHNPIFE
jgi:hypothetical protein